MTEDDQPSLDSLSEELPLTLRGNPPGFEPHASDQQQLFYSNMPLAMAATPPEFDSRQRSYNRRPSRDPSAPNPVELYWKHNRPVLVRNEWSTIRAALPVIAPTTAPTKIKNGIFNMLATRLEAAEGDWRENTELFASLFNDQAPEANIEATLVINDFNNYNSQVYDFLDFQILDSDYKVLTNGNGGDYPATTKTNARFLKFTLAANPQAVNPVDFNIDAAVFPSQVTTTVYLRALRHNDELHPHVSKAMIHTTPKMLIDIYALQGQDFSLSQKTFHEYAPNPDTQKKWLDTLKAKTKYAAMKQLVKELYVGRLEGTKRLSSRIERIKQRVWDPTTGRARFKSITELSQDYQFELQEVTSTTTMDEIPDMENTFYRALSNHMQTRVIDQLSPAPPTTLSQNMARFNRFITICIQEEKAIKDITTVAEQAVARNTRNNYQQRGAGPKGPRTFIAAQQQQAQQFSPQQVYAQQTQQYPLTAVGTQLFPPDTQTQTRIPPIPAVVLPYTFLCAPTTHTQQETMTQAILAMDEASQALTAVSIVEDALQKSSGMRAPMKCFGCDGLPEYADDCHHLWRNCPHKDDRRTWNNFQHNLKLFRERLQTRNNTNYNNNTQSRSQNWQRDGYPTQQAHDQIQAIAHAATTTSTRKVMIATLTEELNKQDHQEPDEQEDAKPSPKKQRKSNRISRNFFTYMQAQAELITPSTFLGAPPLSQYDFKISFKLPFLAFPIGDGGTSNDKATLSGLADTGGCCNMGWLSYHKEIAQRYPELVHEFLDLKEKRYETISIGGLQGGVILTHMIKYLIPYTDRGGACVLTLGLTEDLPIDTLFGVNFQTEAKMTIDLAGRKIWSGVFQDTYTLEFKEPKRTNIAHIFAQEDQFPKTLITTSDA
jgi:hypothetical protein